ncbi:hypothetical protein OV090_48145 [Nannocystis sp. RBIL2]|uniref:hypothetical protein n=1 Tax=Nannocystis sp. RBIL2 TaxID=2996788 RepID=UPI00226F1A40|nr:hypothetical protein [Nannocystis sp. RBIL2]MCY1072612.1 hypothetical protein [Nannocystis sp. RBIL2]
MSIYGPPTPPVRDHARRASAHATRIFLALLVIGALTSVGVIALLQFGKHGSEHLEVERAETIRLDAEARQEAMRLQTAEFMPAIPSPPNLEIPPPVRLQTAESLPHPDDLPTPAETGRMQVAEPLSAPVEVERKSPPAAEPARLQTAELLR